MEPFGALVSEVVDANPLKNMVGPCGLEPQTSTVSKVAQDIILCGLECGLEIITEAAPIYAFLRRKTWLTLGLYEPRQIFQA